MNQLGERYLEDFAAGQTFGSGRTRIDAERALAFAAEFEPQPFHLDEAAAPLNFRRTDRKRLAHRRRDDAAAG
jgi:acyl dehydratase